MSKKSEELSDLQDNFRMLIVAFIIGLMLLWHINTPKSERVYEPMDRRPG
jgi:hypothetical protein